MVKHQLVLELGHVVAQSEDDFMVWEGNDLAFNHVISFPNWVSPAALLEAPAKAGKSHLARVWAERANAVYVVPQTLEAQTLAGGLQPVVIEDVDRAGYDEHALFHFLNQSMRDQRPVLITAREPIAQWPFNTNDVKSRARLAAWFSMSAPDDILLSQILVKLFSDRQLSVEPKVLSYLVSRMERSQEEAVVMVDLIDMLSLSKARAITKSIVAEALALRAARNFDAESDKG